MPESRITWAMLKDHFRRLWAVYLVGAVLLVFLNHLAFTVTRPGFSDDETLKIFRLNVDVPIDEARLLDAVRDSLPQFLALEIEDLAAASADDAAAAMLLATKITAGFGDIYLTDEAGLELLVRREACHPLEGVYLPGYEGVMCTHPETGKTYTAALCRDGICLVVMENGTDIESALAALGPLAAEIME